MLLQVLLLSLIWQWEVCGAVLGLKTEEEFLQLWKSPITPVVLSSGEGGCSLH